MTSPARPHQVTRVHAPGSPEWLAVITPSKVAGILGVSRFTSQYALWHQMSGTVTPPQPDEAKQDDFDYGHAAEAAARLYWQFKNPGWRISTGEVQYANPALPFANRATIDGRASRGSSRRVVEIKTARDIYMFGDDGSGDIPTDYAAQVTAQMLITGWHDPADLVLWPQYGKPRIYTVEWDQEVADLIVAKCEAWMRSIRDQQPPELDDHITTYETVRALHPDIDGTTAQLDRSLAADYLEATARLKRAEAAAREAKTRVLDVMGNAQHAEAGGIKVADRRPHKYGVSLYPNPKATPGQIIKEPTE